MLSKDHSAEFKRRFADRYADGATVAMPQRELGLTKPTARLWREGTDRGGAGAIDGPRRSDRCPQGLELRAAEACLRGEGDYRALALEHGARSGARIRDRVKRYREGGDDALGVRPPGRRRKGPASEETLGQRCARLEMEAGILKRMAASATDISAAGGSTRW